MVNNSTNITKNHLSPNHIEWWSTIPPISTKITSHLNSLSDGQQFHQYQQKSPLTWTHWVMVNNSTQWVKVRGDFCWYWWNCWPSLNEFRWEVIFVDIGGIVDHHQYQQKSPFISIHWVMVNNFTNINKNHLSPQLIEWWSTIPPISTKITSHLNSFSDGKQFHQYQQKSPLTSTHWVMSIITPISTKITSYFNSLNDGQQFHSMSWGERWFLLILVKLLTITNINKNHLSPQYIEWWSTISPISTKITSHFNSLSDVNNSTNINKNHLSPLYIEWWSTIPPISTKITSHLYT